MQRLVECVPNFSEGRNVDTIRALTAAVKAVKGVWLLDEERDADHHRSVLTFAGMPEAVEEAAFQAVRLAATLIDLRRHQGGHPRVGATDVVPFVPIRGVTMEDCVAMAISLGERIARELDIPVYLYERAAPRQERSQLESIRRGGLEGLAARMEDPAWIPDFGPRRLHPTAGATIVGARPPLIAYNVNLQTNNLEVAKAIAKTIRTSSGGLPSLKAIGVPLTSRGIVQVSMNLTNFEATPIHTAFDQVRREAEKQGVTVAGSEIVGLVPQLALLHTAEAALKLERFDPTQVLETRLDLVLAREAGTGSGGETSLSGFLDAVSAGTPTPGGGSVAALAGALAAALGVMVCRIGPPADSAHKKDEKKASRSKPETKSGNVADLRTVERSLIDLGQKLRGLVQADADSYEAVLRAYRLPKGNPARPEAITSSLATATRIPLETAILASEAAFLLRSLIPVVKPAVASDLKVGLIMALAAIEGGLENVATNLKSQPNQKLTDEIRGRVTALQQSLVELKRL
ncbi:MAG TPA: glutamate formimidoyltransferase [Nitrospiraceae bacterium]|nr:glutamate formimidoyltransferase [Nitrospiraceae bacterium]